MSAQLATAPEAIARPLIVPSMLDADFARLSDEVDGGVSAKTLGLLVRRGATVLVAGSAIRRHPDGRAAAIRELQTLALDASVPTAAR